MSLEETSNALILYLLTSTALSTHRLLQGRSRTFVLGTYKTLTYSCSITVLTSFLLHEKFTWTDLGRVYKLYAKPPAIGAYDEDNSIQAAL